MQRQQLQFLSAWLQNKNRKPLIIRGARQVGKSILALHTACGGDLS